MPYVVAGALFSLACYCSFIGQPFAALMVLSVYVYVLLIWAA